MNSSLQDMKKTKPCTLICLLGQIKVQSNVLLIKHLTIIHNSISSLENGACNMLGHKGPREDIEPNCLKEPIRANESDF